jgi:hypothetical protein
MSWSIRRVGMPAGLVEVVKGQQTMPPSLQEAIVSILGDITPPEHHNLILETSGHMDERTPQGTRRWVNIEIKIGTILEA